MSKLSDKDIQDLLEKGENTVSDKNSKLYSEVFKALKAQPEFELPHSFSANVVSALEAKNDSTERIIYFFGILGAITSLILALAMIVIFGDEGMLQYMPHLLIGSAVILLVQYLDEKVKDITITAK